MFTGEYRHTVDEKGRLKLPAAFLSVLLAQHGPELFVTSVTGEYVRLYPMAVWLEVERRASGHGPAD